MSPIDSYIPIDALEYQSPEILARVRSDCRKAKRRDEIPTRKKFLGHYYANELLHHKHPKCTIKPVSEIVGHGVFIDEDVPKNAFLGEYIGVVKKMRLIFHSSNDYCFDYAIGESFRNPFYIDALERGNHTRFINHSPQGNLEPVSVFHEGIMHIILLSTRPIKAGEQLTYDYGDHYWRRRSDPFIL